MRIKGKATIFKSQAGLRFESVILIKVKKKG